MKPKNILNYKLFVTTQSGKVANGWKCSYFSQHPLQTTCNMSEDVHYKQECAVRTSHIFSMSKDVKYMQVDHPVLVQGTLLQMLPIE